MEAIRRERVSSVIIAKFRLLAHVFSASLPAKILGLCYLIVIR
jgi:hypothetical protein